MHWVVTASSYRKLPYKFSFGTNRVLSVGLHKNHPIFLEVLLGNLNEAMKMYV